MASGCCEKAGTEQRCWRSRQRIRVSGLVLVSQAAPSIIHSAFSPLSCWNLLHLIYFQMPRGLQRTLDPRRRLGAGRNRWRSSTKPGSACAEGRPRGGAEAQPRAAPAGHMSKERRFLPRLASYPRTQRRGSRERLEPEYSASCWRFRPILNPAD